MHIIYMHIGDFREDNVLDNLLVSVIIPVYKVEKYLNQCVDSVLNQTYRNLEVILVDDGSPDNCPRICDLYAETDRRVKVIHKKNGGVSSAREAGMHVATGDYVIFVDSDDWIDLSTIEICMQEVKKRPEIGCVLFSYIKELPNGSIPMKILDFSIYLTGDEAKDKIYRRLFGLIKNELSHPERMENMSSCWMKLYRADYAKQGKYYDIKDIGSCEDGLFNMYALQKCNNILYLDMPLYHYRKIENSLTSSFRPDFIKQWENLFSIMQNIIVENELGNLYEEALSNRIALSITAVGLNELNNPSHGMFGHIKEIKKYLRQEKYHNAVKQLEIDNMPFVWKLLMICCKLKLATAVYMAINAVNILRKR